MLFPSLFVALGLASTVVVQARSNLSAETEINPKSWTTYGSSLSIHLRFPTPVPSDDLNLLTTVILAPGPNKIDYKCARDLSLSDPWRTFALGPSSVDAATTRPN